MINNKVESIKEHLMEIMKILEIEPTDSNKNTSLRIAKMWVNEVFANINWRNEYEIRNIYQTNAASAGLWHRHDDCASIPDGGSVIARASRRYVRPSCRLMRIEHTSLQDGKVFSLWTAWFWYMPVASAIAHREHEA